jgi:pilus assembly protein CpaB
MENRRAILISLICFTISMVLILSYVRVRRYEMTSEFGEEVRVIVANVDIPEYAIIRPDMLREETVFKNFRQPTSVVDIADAVGRASFVPIYKDEQVTLTKLVEEDGKPVLDRQVEKSKRAITLQVAPHTGVGHLIRPGNRIDIMASVNYDSNGATIYEIKTVVQNVLVLATGKHIQNAVPTRVNRDVLNILEEQFEARRRKDFNGGGTETLHTAKPDDNYTHITVQLSPEDAEKILFLTHTYGDGRLYYTLRNNADQNVEKMETALLDDVLGPESDYGRSKRKPPPLPAPKGPRFNDSKGGIAVPIY